MKERVLLVKLVCISIVVLLLSATVSASTTDCQNLHIGRIWVEKGTGLRAVVYLNNRGDSSGSYWSTFDGWSRDDKKEAFAMLMAAKAANHRVNVETENADKCGLHNSYTVTKSLYLTTNP
jgi:hypothetical protein